MTSVNKRNSGILKISMVAVFGAMSFICTAFFPIPIAGGQGYLNFSDTFIFLIAALISPLTGGLVGSLSGALSDLYAGYGSFAPYTAGIKLLEGVVAGYLFIWLRNLLGGSRCRFLALGSFFIGGLIMAFLYMIPDLVMYSEEIAWIDLPFNIIQGSVNAVIAAVGFMTLSQTSVFSSVGFNKKRDR